MKPMLDENEVQWNTILDTKPEVEGQCRFLNVVGTYRHITYTGTVAVDQADDAEIKRVIVRLKASITNLIINALDREAMDARATFTLGPLELIEEEPKPDDPRRRYGRIMKGVLDGDEATTRSAAFWTYENEKDQLADGTETIEELSDRAKMLIWTDWRQEERV